MENLDYILKAIIACSLLYFLINIIIGTKNYFSPKLKIIEYEFFVGDIVTTKEVAKDFMSGKLKESEFGAMRSYMVICKTESETPIYTLSNLAFNNMMLVSMSNTMVLIKRGGQDASSNNSEEYSE